MNEIKRLQQLAGIIVETRVIPKNSDYIQLKPVMDIYFEDHDIYDREAFDESYPYLIDDITSELAYIKGFIPSWEGNYKVNNVKKYNSFDDFTKDEDIYKKYNNLAAQYLHKYGYEKFNVDETKIGPKPQNPEYLLHKFINDNFDEFNSLEESETIEFGIDNFNKSVVDLLKEYYAGFYVYRGIAVYYIVDKDKIGVENVDLNETKIAPKQQYYAVVNPYANDGEPTYYFTGTSEQEIINKLNRVVQYFKNKTNSSGYNFKYGDTDLDDDKSHKVIIYDDWAFVTVDKDIFEKNLKDYKNPQQFKFK